VTASEFPSASTVLASRIHNGSTEEFTDHPLRGPKRRRMLELSGLTFMLLK
jgi:hypothetical protein